jgi:hypothetical protein
MVHPVFLLTVQSPHAQEMKMERMSLVTTGFTCEDDDTRNPPTPIGGGDPHFRTWHGEKYRYHGACDLVLLHSDKFDNGLGMDIHIRTKHRGQFSYITTAALRIGDEILEVTGQDGRGYLNGEANVAMSAKIAGHGITYNRHSDVQQTFLVHVNKQTVVIKTWHDIFFRCPSSMARMLTLAMRWV